MRPGNHHRVRAMRAAGMKIPAILAHYGIDRAEYKTIMVQKGAPKRKRHTYDPVQELISEGCCPLVIVKVFPELDLRKVHAQSAENSPPLSVAAD
jgi:hypothetical protein